MPSTPRPTLSDARALVNAVGGDMQSLTYNTPVTGAAGVNNTPQLISVVQVSGIWGQFWFQVGMDQEYSLLQFVQDVTGNKLNNNLALPQNWTVVINPDGPNACQRFRDQIFTGDPQFTIEFPTLSGKAREDAERDWTAYLQQELQLEEQASAQSPIDEQKQHECDYGLGVRYDVLDLSRWPERPKLRRGAGNGKETREEFNARMSEWEATCAAISPFVVRTVHPLNVAFDLGSNPPKWMMVREPIWPWEAAARFPYWADTVGGPLAAVPTVAATPLTKVEVWWDDWCGTWINGQPAWGPKEKADGDGIAPNKYGHLPAVFAAGGRGQADVNNRPEVVLQGLYRNLRPTLRELALIDNLIGVYMRAISFGPKKNVFAPEPSLDQERMTAFIEAQMAGPQMIGRADTAWRIETYAPPTAPPDVWNRRQQLLEIISEATAYPVAAGAPQSGPAAKMQLQLSQVQKRTSVEVLHLQQALEQWAKNRLRTLKKLLADEKVGVGIKMGGKGTQMKRLDPASLPDVINITCNLTTDSETEKARKEQAGLALLQNPPEAGGPLITPYEFQEKYLSNPDAQQTVGGTIAWNLFQQIVVPAAGQYLQSKLMEMYPQLAAMQAAQAQQVDANGQPITPATQTAAPQTQAMQVGPSGTVLPGESNPGGPMGNEMTNPLNSGALTAGQTNGVVPRPQVAGY